MKKFFLIQIPLWAVAQTFLVVTKMVASGSVWLLTWGAVLTMLAATALNLYFFIRRDRADRLADRLTVYFYARRNGASYES